VSIGGTEKKLAHDGPRYSAIYEIDGPHVLSYPDAWRAARERIRLGGLYICDNVLWSGYVVDSSSEEAPRTEAIREHNRLITQDERYLSTIVPTRDGGMVALRVA
jgi:predicted O-methyltransferase YrrM